MVALDFDTESSAAIVDVVEVGLVQCGAEEGVAVHSWGERGRTDEIFVR